MTEQLDLEDWLRENPANKCKDCNYSDEFCASGDCPNDTIGEKK